MLTFFHRYNRYLLLIVTFIIIVSFVLLFNIPLFEFSGNNKLGKIDGKAVTQDDLIVLAQEIRFDWELSNGQRLPAQLESRLFDEALQTMVMKAEAKKIGIQVSNEEVANVIVRMPDFQTDGKFDEAKYNEFTTYTLVANRLSRNSLENIIHRRLLTRKLQMIIGATAKVTPQEVEQAFREFVERPVIEYVTLRKEDFRKDLKPYSENELKAAYAQYASVLKTGEERKVRYIKFNLPAASSITIPKEKIDEMITRAQGQLVDDQGKPMSEKAARDYINKELTHQKQMEVAVDQANGFAAKFIPDDNGNLPNFSALASENKLPVVESDYFFRRSPVKGVNDEVFNQIAFSLSKEYPVSDPILAGESFVVMELVDVKPERPMEFDEAKEQLQILMVDSALNELLADNARQSSQKIKDALSSGKTFQQAAAELKLKVSSPKPVAVAELSSLISVEISDEERAVRQAGMNMPIGGVSDFIPTENGGVIAYLKNREIPEGKNLTSDAAEFSQGYIRAVQNRIFSEWLTEIVNASNLPRIQQD